MTRIMITMERRPYQDTAEYPQNTTVAGLRQKYRQIVPLGEHDKALLKGQPALSPEKEKTTVLSNGDTVVFLPRLGV